MIKLFPCYVLNLVLMAFAAVFALPGRLLAAPLIERPLVLIRLLVSDLPSLRARSNPSAGDRIADFDLSAKTAFLAENRVRTRALSGAVDRDAIEGVTRSFLGGGVFARVPDGASTANLGAFAA